MHTSFSSLPLFLSLLTTMRQVAKRTAATLLTRRKILVALGVALLALGSLLNYFLWWRLPSSQKLVLSSDMSDFAAGYSIRFDSIRFDSGWLADDDVGLDSEIPNRPVSIELSQNDRTFLLSFPAMMKVRI